MKCSLLTLSCALDGELSRERQAELDAHLITCDRCRTGLRYLREETERISALAQVTLSEETATALLERSRVLAAAGPAALPRPPDVEAADQMHLAPDPFGTIGLDTTILEMPDPPPVDRASTLEQEPPTATPEMEEGSAAAEVAADRDGGGDGSTVPKDLWLARADSDPDLFESDSAASEQAAPTPAADDASGPPGLGADDPFLTGTTIAEDTNQAPSPVGDQAREVRDPRPSTIVVPGWEPATSLNFPWADSPPAQPSESTWASELTGVPVRRPAPLPPPAAALPAAGTPPPPAGTAVPGVEAESGAPKHQPDTSSTDPDGGYRRPARPPHPRPSQEPRSWTRTGLIAVAALAIVLIGWNLLHGGSKPAVSHHPTGQATASAKPSPSSASTPKPAPTPVALSGVQAVGSTGSGYQVQTVRYGVHGSQLWVVFQMVDGSGAPKVTAGFDGPDTLYIEMQGVAPGTQVPQPAAGEVVSSTTVGQDPGFSGAVYILHLTRPVQLSPSLLPGTESGGAGERYIAILQ